MRPELVGYIVGAGTVLGILIVYLVISTWTERRRRRAFAMSMLKRADPCRDPDCPTQERLGDHVHNPYRDSFTKTNEGANHDRTE